MLMGSWSVWSGQVPLVGDAGRWVVADVNPGQPFGADLSLCRDLQNYSTYTVIAFRERLSVAASLSHFRGDERDALSSLW